MRSNAHQIRPNSQANRLQSAMHVDGQAHGLQLDAQSITAKLKGLVALGFVVQELQRRCGGISLQSETCPVGDTLPRRIL